MRTMRRFTTVCLLLTLLAGSAQAMDDAGEGLGPVDRRPAEPRAAITAALMNVLFLPIRIPVTFLGAHVAGLTGFLTGANRHAADDVFGLVDGTQVITPQMLVERRGFRFSAYD